ncbi:MAG: hypothetical protein KC733_02190, partial [Candidatus Omnitrophica bacterium]|nr:hypothetical protein [Candidatus Omnitrophota bacterium]
MKIEFVFKDDFYKCDVYRFSEEQLKGIDWKNSCVPLNRTDKSGECIHSFEFIAKDKEDFDFEIIKGLPKTINWEEDKDFDKKIGYLFNGLYSDYSYIWFNKSMASGGGERASSAEVVLTIILRNLLLEKCEKNPNESKLILEQFLTTQYRFLLFKRFILLCVDKFWKNYSVLFEKFLQVVPSALNESDLNVELHDVLLNHNTQFSIPLVERIKEKINNVPDYYVKKGEKDTAYWKYKWLSPLKNHPGFFLLYEESKRKADLKVNNSYTPDRETIKVLRVNHHSPLSKDKILEIPVSTIIKELNEFQEDSDRWRIREEGLPDKEGFADMLQSAVRENPKKFTDALDDFFKTDYFYLHRVLRGLRDVWNDGKDIDWENIFTFGLKYFNRDSDQILKEVQTAQGKDACQGRYIWLVDDFVDLIADGSRKDDHAFDPKYFDLASKIFDFIIPLLKGESSFAPQRDAMTYALNTTLGRVVMGYISFSLRVARSTGKKEAEWGKRKYERFFSKGIDPYILIGRYLPQFKYLDPEYTNQKIEFFEQLNEDNFQWQMFMEGYLTGSRIYNDLYRLMRGNYIKALDSKLFNDHVDNRLVEHISIGYLNL